MKSKVKILFISGMRTDFSTGEFSQIRLFTNSFDDTIEYKIILRKTDYFQFNTQELYFYDNNQELKNYISFFNPSIIILSEYQHLNKDFLDYIYTTNITICTMDSSSLSKLMYTPPENTIYLKNCPLNNPQKNTKYDKYWFFAQRNNKILSKNDIENKFSLVKDSKIVFMSVAPWQYTLSVSEGLDKFYSFVINLLIGSLILHNNHVSLFFIYPRKDFNNIVIEKDKVKVLFFDSLDNQTYESILYNSDLVISDNITQVSMAKAFIDGINVLSLINTSERNLLNLFKFNIFPYNYDFLPKLYSLDYCKLINKVEVFNKEEVSITINRLLSNKENNHLDYVSKCNELLSSREIIEEISKSY